MATRSRRTIEAPGPTRRALLAGIAGLAALSAGGAARAALPPPDAEAIDAVQQYLNGVHTLEAAFQQVAPNGAISTGKVYLQRPGKLRFDYDPPSQILIVATDWRLIYWDGSIDQENVIPIAKTPLGFLLDEHISLSGDVTVTDVSFPPEEIAIAVIRTAAADQGHVVLVFGKRPMELRRWTVTDAQGLTTQILLSDLQTNLPLDPELFHWRDPKLFGPPKS
jgi:outer membrane lipoprotein-sorting protein